MSWVRFEGKLCCRNSSYEQFVFRSIIIGKQVSVSRGAVSSIDCFVRSFIGWNHCTYLACWDMALGLSTITVSCLAMKLTARGNSQKSLDSDQFTSY